MKKFLLSLILLAFTALCSFAENSEPQRALVSVMGGNIPLLSVMNQIEKQTDYLFVYSEDINVDTNVEIVEGKSSVKSCLGKALKGVGLKFYFDNNYIIITKDTPETISISGKVRDSSSKEPLMFASVSVTNSTISNVSNGDGYFLIKFPNKFEYDSLKISYLGYESRTLAIKDLVDSDKIHTIDLKPSPFILSALVVTAKDPELIVAESIRRINKNYPQDQMRLTGFYREMIKKGSTYVTLTEAALDINKAAYGNTLIGDQTEIYKGRGSVAWNKIDTVFVKFRGGINSTLETDIMKYPFLSVFPSDINYYYSFSMDVPINIDGKQHYVIRFKPNDNIEDVLFNGKLYIEMESYALARAEFSIDTKDVDKTTKLFIKRKPQDLKTKLLYANYLIQYKEYDGKWMFDYSRTEMKFDAKWDGKWFKNTYTIISEMAITERSDEVSKIPYSRRVKFSDITLDKVSDFNDTEFWQDYNVIEPESGIQSVIKKIIRQLNRKNTN